MMQRTDEWFAARCGLATASRFKDILARIKSGEAAARRNYKAQLVCERLTGVPYENGFESAEMRFGTEQEPFARMAYEERHGVMVEEVGFIRHETLMAGCSPDGLVGEDGLVEFKVPNTANHIDTLEKGMPPEHLPQIMGQLWLTGRKWCHFVSFDPRMPERLRLYVQRVERDDEYIANLEKEVRAFLDEVEAKYLSLLKLAEAA